MKLYMYYFEIFTLPQHIKHSVINSSGNYMDKSQADACNARQPDEGGTMTQRLATRAETIEPEQATLRGLSCSRTSIRQLSTILRVFFEID